MSPVKDHGLDSVLIENNIKVPVCWLPARVSNSALCN